MNQAGPAARRSRERDSETLPPLRVFADNEDDTHAEVVIDGKSVIVDKTDDGLIITDECKKIMRNLCSAQPREAFQSDTSNITQPSFLSHEDRILYFKTKMFYLLQERNCFMEQQQQAKTGSSEADASQVTAAEAYPTFLTPFFNFTGVVELPSSSQAFRRIRQPTEVRLMTDGTMGTATRPGQKAKGKAAREKEAQLNSQKTGMIKFLENIRKADKLVLQMLDEKVLKTIEGAGYATLFSGQKEVRKVEIIQCLFPDYSLLLLDGKDEESRLNNLVSHVRTRMKVFDKLQAYYENPNREDHTAHVFTVPNVEVAGMHDELISLKPKRLHQLDERKMAKLYLLFRDDYGAAKTSLVADGTQPVVLNRKKLDRVKKYVDECADWKSSTLVPYVRETNFFCLVVPWVKGYEPKTTADSTVLSLDDPQ